MGVIRFDWTLVETDTPKEQTRQVYRFAVTKMSELIGRSQGATGALQAAQAGNQLLALQGQQLADLTAVVAANGRAQALADARKAPKSACANRSDTSRPSDLPSRRCSSLISFRIGSSISMVVRMMRNAIALSI